MRGRVCRLQLQLVLAGAVIIRSESRGTHSHILLSQIRDSPNLKGQVPVFISPRNRMARLYPQALGSLLVSSYDLQGYGGGIPTSIACSVEYLQGKSSTRTPRKTPFSVVENESLLARYLVIDICEAHRKHLLRHWFYCCVFRALPRNGSTCHDTFTHKVRT
jgi:hypothetical protein